MTITHYACLELLAQRPGLSNSELARGAFVTRQSMNVLLQALERQGLVVRPAQAPVGRARAPERTARGRRQLKMASAAVRRVEQDMLANLDTGEQDQMRRLLTACIAALRDSFQVPDQRPANSLPHPGRDPQQILDLETSPALNHKAKLAMPSSATAARVRLFPPRGRTAPGDQDGRADSPGRLRWTATTGGTPRVAWPGRQGRPHASRTLSPSPHPPAAVRRDVAAQSRSSAPAATVTGTLVRPGTCLSASAWAWAGMGMPMLSPRGSGSAARTVAAAWGVRG